MFHNAISYAVELRHLDANPIDRIGWKALAVAQTVVTYTTLFFIFSGL